MFVKLIQFMRLNNNELSKYVNKGPTNSGEDVIKNYLNLNNNELVRGIEILFLEDTNISRDFEHYLEFLRQTWSEGTVDENDEEKIINIWFKLMTSRFIHIKSTKTEKTNFSRTIGHFIYSSGGRFPIDFESYVNYLCGIGDFESMLFNPKLNFIKLFKMNDKYINRNDRCVNFCKKHLSTNSLKARFDRDISWADPDKNLLRKVILSIKYYCWSKWIALLADRFIAKKGNINPNLDVGLDQKKENIEPIKKSNQDEKETVTEPEHKNDNGQQAL